jgi:hypothetical protein
MVAFDNLTRANHRPIPLRMLFTIKMDFTRKARLVAGGHTTAPPEVAYLRKCRLTRQRTTCIPHCEDERPYHDRHRQRLYAECAKYYAIAGKEFGEMAAVEVVIVRAPLWTKIAGASMEPSSGKELRDRKFSMQS